jgi:hypothetical protein
MSGKVDATAWKNIGDAPWNGDCMGLSRLKSQGEKKILRLYRE